MEPQFFDTDLPFRYHPVMINPYAKAKNDRKRESEMKKVLKITAIVAVVLLLAAYGVGCWYFYTHYFYGTKIDGVVYGCMTPEEVAADVTARQQNYSLTIEGRYEMEEVRTGEELGATIDPLEELTANLHRQRPWMWPVSFFETFEDELTDSIRINEDTFTAQAEAMSFFKAQNQVAPVDAKLSDYLPEKKGYEVIAEVEGSTIHKEDAIEAIREAVMTRQTTLDLTGAEYYEEPKVFSDDEFLNKEMEELNAYTNLTFSYDMHGVPVTVDGDQIHEWLVCAADGTVTVDEELANAYVKELANTYNTYGKVRTFTTVKGVEKQLKSGAYGWKMDVDAEQEALLTMLADKKSVSHTPQWTKEGYVTGENDIGKTYVEIDLSAQHLYFIKDGSIIMESDFVSGNMARGWGTPGGVFGLTYKTRNAVLRGTNYETPVSYWMPFNGNIGMHDANWRSSFGGDIYQTNGSHGCINMPVNKAKEIYGYVEKNMPVVCYY